MHNIVIIAQGVLIGFVAGVAFPDTGWEFWAIIVANPVLTVAYGISKGN